jgi:hypothetical protein
MSSIILVPHYTVTQEAKMTITLTNKFIFRLT